MCSPVCRMYLHCVCVNDSSRDVDTDMERQISLNATELCKTDLGLKLSLLEAIGSFAIHFSGPGIWASVHRKEIF